MDKVRNQPSGQRRSVVSDDMACLHYLATLSLTSVNVHRSAVDNGTPSYTNRHVKGPDRFVFSVTTILVGISRRRVGEVQFQELWLF